MKLKWSKAANGNWNGKAGPYTMMVVSFHEAGVLSGWWLHPKLPGLKGQRVEDWVEGKDIGDHLFSEWLKTIGVA
jgi:hypothetical protein